MPRNAATQNNNTENMEQHVPFKVTITEHNPERGVLANADVNVAGIMTRDTSQSTLQTTASP